MIIDGINLPQLDALKWADEYEWSPVAQTQDRGVTGSFIVQEQLKLHGRPITLIGEPDSNWIQKEDLDLIRAREILVNHEFDVTLPDGQTFHCKFNRNGGAAIRASQVFAWEGIPGPATHYTIQTLRLITVEP